MDIKNKVKKWLDSLAVSGTPDEYEVKNLLKEVGIAVPPGKRFGAKEKISVPELNPPFVLKVCSCDVMHKTDLGGVVLNIARKSLEKAADEMREKFPGQMLLVEEQVSSENIEFIVGGLVDPVFGLSIMIGVGGILTELYKDVTFRLIPCSREEAGRMIDELKISPIFEGFRGMEINRAGFVDLIVTVSDLITTLGDRFDQLDLNPVVYSNNRFIALDAKLIMRDTSVS